MHRTASWVKVSTPFWGNHQTGASQLIHAAWETNRANQKPGMIEASLASQVWWDSSQNWSSAINGSRLWEAQARTVRRGYCTLCESSWSLWRSALVLFSS